MDWWIERERERLRSLSIPVLCPFPFQSVPIRSLSVLFPFQIRSNPFFFRSRFLKFPHFGTDLERRKMAWNGRKTDKERTKNGAVISVPVRSSIFSSERDALRALTRCLTLNERSLQADAAGNTGCALQQQPPSATGTHARPTMQGHPSPSWWAPSSPCSSTCCSINLLVGPSNPSCVTVGGMVTVVEPITSVNGLFALPFRHPITLLPPSLGRDSSNEIH